MRHREENEMNYLTEFQASRQRNEDKQVEVAVDRTAAMALEDRETRPYVVRDLSWELARYLDTQDLQESA